MQQVQPQAIAVAATILQDNVKNFLLNNKKTDRNIGLFVIYSLLQTILIF